MQPPVASYAHYRSPYFVTTTPQPGNYDAYRGWQAPPPSGAARTPRSTVNAAPSPASAKDDASPDSDSRLTPVKRSSAGSGKQAFFDQLRPLVEAENARIIELRGQVIERLGRFDANAPLTDGEQRHLIQLAKKYRVQGDPLTDAEARQALIQKIDVIPVSLALAQAANESAWGTSRFAKEGNNLFGIWTYDASKGIKPLKRAPGKKHLVRKFDSLADSVRYYLHTLNSHPAYADLRDIRAEARAAGESLDGTRLAAGLKKYSAKGDEYIRRIRAMIDSFDLQVYDIARRDQA